MKLHPQTGLRLLLTFLLISFITFSTTAQGTKKIDWSKDTVSMADANASRNEYRNSVKGRATEKISLPVDKLKEILDACAANGITNVDVLIGKVRASDIAHYKNFNKNSPDNELLGIQVLVFRVPRSAFGGNAAAQINAAKGNPLMLSLLAVGLQLIDEQKAGLPAGTGDYYFSFGAICPPPMSCD